MAIQIGTGEPVSRARRGLDVKGKVNFGLDETIVPVTILSDLTDPPFRRSPVRWYSRTIVGPVAGLLGGVRLANTSGRDQLVDQIIFRTPAAAVLLIGSGLGIAPGAGTPARTTEIVTVPPNATGDISRQIPIEALGFTVTPTTLFDIFMGIAAEDGNSLVVPVQIVLPAAPRPELPAANVTTLTAELTDAQIAVEITFSGLYFDQLPLNALT